MAQITIGHHDEELWVRPAGWYFWFWWVLASTVGWGVGGSLGSLVGGATAVAMGVTVAGLLQWAVLRPWVQGASWWVLASILAVPVAGIIGFAGGVALGVFGGLDVVAEAGTVGVVVGGTALGVLQWVMVLKRRAKRAGWWVLASTVAWVVAGFVSGAVDPAVGVAVIGAVYGTITGAVLMWLLRQPGAPMTS